MLNDSAGIFASGMFVSKSKNAPINVVKIPKAIQTRLHGHIQINGKNPARSTVSGSQISAELVGIQKLRIILATQRPTASHPAVFVATDFFGFSGDDPAS